MKTLVTLITCFLVVLILNAQTPLSLKYQAVVRDNTGAILSNQPVSFRLSIRTGSPVGGVVYQETHSTITNLLGLANLNIGEGTPTIGTFSLIDWSSGLKYIETELDPLGGSSYISLGTSQMLSVPYAFYSENTANVDDADADPLNELQTISKVGNTVTLSDGGGSFTDDINDADADPTNELQNLSIAGNDLSISGGSTVVLPSELPLGTSGQTMRHDGAGWQATGNLFNDGTNVGIGSIPVSSAILDINSTTKGMLVPRMTSAQRIAIAAPANGLLVYNIDTQTFWYYQNTAWIELIGTGNNSGLSDADNDTRIQVEETTDEDKIRFDMAGTEFFVMDNGRLDVVNTGRSIFVGTRAGANDDLTENHNNFIGYYAGEANITGENNTALGYFAMRSNFAGSYNTATGAGALQNNNGGLDNTANGAFALWANTFGLYNTAAGYSALLNNNGNGNTASGFNSLKANTTGEYNVASGYSSLQSNSTGKNNTATGKEALLSNTTGHSNVAMGVSSLQNSTENSNLVAIGDSALFNNGVGATNFGEGSYNTAIGSKALYNNTTGLQNTATGYHALYSNNIGFGNTANGIAALYSNTDGINNVAIGLSALVSNQSGSMNIAVGAYALGSNIGGANTATGYHALSFNYTGEANTAYGNYALYQNYSGNYNVANGYEAMMNNNTGFNNTAIGHSALFSNSSGHSNVAMGVSALHSNIDRSNIVAIGDSALYNNGIGVVGDLEGAWNTAVGSKALLYNSTGSFNTSIGFETLYDNTSGYWNTANGFVTLRHNTIGHDNTAIGSYALSTNTEGVGNTANGFHALSGNTIGNYNTSTGTNALSENTIGSYNTAIGLLALWDNRTGSNNTAIGANALSADTSGHSNVAVGVSALNNTSNGSNLVAIGDSALYYNGWGDFYFEAVKNTAVGSKALYSNKTGASNTALGFHAGLNTDSGDNNTYMGASSGLNNVIGSGNVFLGHEAGMNETGSNKLIIANNSGSQLIYGDFTSGNIGLGVTPPTEKLQVAGTIHSTINGFKFPDGSIQTSAATAFSLPYAGSSTNDFPFTITNTAGSAAIRGFATDNSTGINYGGYFEAYRTQGRGVAGATNGSQGWGVYGLAIGSNGTGVRGEASGANGTGIYGAGSAWAGYFLGNLYTSGNVGFGTITPAEELEVYKDQNDLTSIQLTNPNTGTAAGSIINFTSGSGIEASIWYKNTVYAFVPKGLRINTYSSDIGIDAGDNDLNLQYSGGVGRVAIGMAYFNSHLSKLDVHSSYRYSGHFTADSTSSLSHAVHAEYQGGTADGKGVFGKSVPSDYWGYGGYFEGGYMGVRGEVFPSGSNVYFGLSGTVNGGSGTNYAVWGYANGSGTNYAGYFDGNVMVTGIFYNPSDEKLKENIQPFSNALSKINQLNVHTFEFRNKGDAESINLPSGSQVGFIAQEMEEVFPHLVKEQVHTFDRNQGIEEAEKDIEQFTYKGVNYVGMIPVLTQAIKEQQEIIENQQSQIDELMQMVLELKRN